MPETKTTTCVHVWMEEDELGRLARCIAAADVNIERFVAERRQARVWTDHPERTVEALEAEGFDVEAEEVLEVRVPNRPGELAQVVEELLEAGVRLDATFGSVRGADGVVLVQTFDIQKARDALERDLQEEPRRKAAEAPEA